MLSSTYTFADVERRFAACVQETSTLGIDGDYSAAHLQQRIIGGPDGVPGEEILKRFRMGYAPDFARNVNAQGLAEIPRPALVYNTEEGIIDLDMALNGEEVYRVMWEDVPTPGTVTVRVQMGFTGHVRARYLNAYLEWCLQAIKALEGGGYSVAVEIEKAGHFGSTPYSAVVRLSEPGNPVDVRSFGAFLSPGAYRTIGWFLIACVCEDYKRELPGGYGHPHGPGYSISRDEDDRILITSYKGGGGFDTDAMDRAFEALVAEGF